MPVELLVRPQSMIPNAEFMRDTSFGSAVYSGVIDHVDGRTNSYVETVPECPAFPDTAFIVCGGFTSEVSPEHNDYQTVQRQLAVHGEHSFGVGHNQHKNYEIGDNVDDIVQTYAAVVSSGISKVILVGHSMGCPEVLLAYKKIHELADETATGVTDIILVDPACFVEHNPKQLVTSIPLFVAEALAGFIKDPVGSTLRRLSILKNVFTNRDKYVKEARFLLSNCEGPSMVAEIKNSKYTPKIHFVLGLWDGLTPGTSIERSVRDIPHDSLANLRAGHLDFACRAKVIDIMHAKVRIAQVIAADILAD